MSVSPPNFHPLINKLESIVNLSAEERQAILALPVTVRSLKADQDIVRDQDRPSQCCVLLAGFACRYKLVEGGRRQILSFHIPGDIPDLQSLHLKVMDHNLATLVPSQVALIAHTALRALIRSHPRIGEVLWRDTLIDAAVFREWMVSLGRRPAYSRVAHLLCELLIRLRAVGLTEELAYNLPVTQAQIGDALGLSTVHVNRTLQQLKADGLISASKGAVVVENWAALEAAGEFDPTYLHLKHGPA